MNGNGTSPKATLFGHPVGLFTLFFAEMWERFSFYGMRALLVLYMIKGFLGYNDNDAYTVYGAYTALVYMTPFFGGMIADRLLGHRRAVVLGGLLMAAGHLLMGVEQDLAFFTALALLIAGNGFFKPNISTMVGSLYPQGSPKRDGGFTLFYMGINLGAGMAPLLCGYIGETYGWHLGFGLATAGMLTGVAVFVAPTRVTQVLIGLGAAGGLFGLITERPDNPFSLVVNLLVGLVLIVSGVVACIALQRGGLPKETGAPPDPERLRKPLLLGISRQTVVYLATILAIPIIMLVVSGFAPFTADARSVSLIPEDTITEMKASDSGFVQVLGVIIQEVSRLAGLLLLLAGIGALGYLLFETFRMKKIARERMFVVLILTFFSLIFWSFFEQAGSSINNFTDRNVDRVFEERVLGSEDVGRTITIQPTQEQLGRHNGDQLFTLDDLTELRREQKDAEDGNPNFEIEWTVAPDNVGMAVGDRLDEIPATMFQSVNPIFILIFGLPFTALWVFLANRRREPSTPVKFSLGLLQLGLGFGALWMGAQNADDRGMVALPWLFLGYMLHTTGELCLSPVGLSMVTKLSPMRLVSTVMGSWFLATAFSQYLAAIISQFTGVPHGDGGNGAIPPPSETVDIYGGVFGKIAIAGMACAAVLFVLSPVLKRWMHEGEQAESE